MKPEETRAKFEEAKKAKGPPGQWTGFVGCVVAAPSVAITPKQAGNFYPHWDITDDGVFEWNNDGVVVAYHSQTKIPGHIGLLIDTGAVQKVDAQRIHCCRCRQSTKVHQCSS